MLKGRRLVLLGAGGHARETYALLEAAGLHGSFAGFAEDTPPQGKTVHGYPVFATADLEGRDPTELLLCAAIGTPARKRLVQRFLDLGFEFETLWHPTAQRGIGVEVGSGTMVGPGAILVADLTVGSHVIVNSGAVLSHDSRVGDFTTISPRACLNGGVNVGSEVFIGTGAVLVPGVVIGDRAVVGAGACVLGDVEPETTVVGVPARPIRRTRGTAGTHRRM